MSIRSFEMELLQELKEKTGRKKLQLRDLKEWSTGVIDIPRENEDIVYLPLLQVYCCISRDEKKGGE